MREINAKLNAMKKNHFLILQIVIAVVLASLGSACILFLNNNAEDALNTMGLAGALILCGGVPMLLNREIERPMKRLNLFIVVTIVVILGIYVLMRFVL